MSTDETSPVQAEAPPEEMKAETTPRRRPTKLYVPATEETKAVEPATEETKAVEPAAEEAKAEDAKAEEPKKDGPRPLPPGWFRAAPQMMSLVGCSEPEMANVLQGLGYRVHPPSEENGPLSPSR